jgi:pilus assembly protein CpaB
MKPKTMILMVVAVGCGLGASYMTSRLLAERNNKPTEEVATVPVLVAKARVPGWQPIKEAEKLFEVKQFPEDVAPKKALGSIAEISGQRLNKPLDEGKPVTQDDLLTKEQADISHQLQPGQRAIAIKVTAESSISGFVLPGSRVDVVCTTRGNDPSSKVVLQNMLVLAVDTQDQRNPEQKTIIGQTVTVAATANEATRLALAGSIGELRLMLKGHGDTKRIGNVVVKASDLDKPLSQNDTSDKVETTPTPPPTAVKLPVITEEEKGVVKVEEPKPVIEKPRKRHVMTIINGTQRERAVFTEGDDDDIESSPANETPTAPPKKEEKPQAKKDEPKPATRPAAPAGPTAPVAGRSTKTKRIQ